VLAIVFPFVTLLNYLQERRRAEQAQVELTQAKELGREVLRESEFRYQRLVGNISDAIIMGDAEGRLGFVNRRFREWVGVEDRDVGTIVLEDYVAPEWRAALREQHQRRMNGEIVPQEYEYEGTQPGGKRIWIEALVTTIEKDGRIVGTQAALRDITERKRMQA